jgi:probable H4MPT-linked C1 transfer pathway protein
MKASVIGWDIGGVNTKVVRVVDGVVGESRTHPYEIQRDPLALVPLLRSLSAEVGAAAEDRHAVTMTAELSQMFRTKRDGVAYVLDAVARAFPASDVRVYTVDGRFLTPAEARAEPLAVAASNWAATARVVAVDHRDAMLIDIGTTTTDIIPIAGGRVAGIGATDPARLSSGELVYTGALRTPAEAITTHVPLGDVTAGVSAESFALIGDVHVWRGDLPPDDYTVTAPDGRPATREFAAERIARIVCADRDMLDDDAVSAIADAVALAQVKQIARALERVHLRHPAIRVAVVTGLGAFIAERAARRCGLEVVRLADTIGGDAARCAPAAAVALHLEQRSTVAQPGLAAHVKPNVTRRAASVDVVVKVGGSLLDHPDRLDAALSAIASSARDTRVAIVPGGGPFADAVRVTGRTLALPDDAAHWMAILAMDQYAHLLATRHPRLALAESLGSVEPAIAARRVPVIAPFRLLRASDPLPHSWDVTSDSLSAWIAGALGARRLVLVKSPGARGDDVVDAYFSRALPPELSWSIVHADDLESLRAALRPS